MLKSIPLFRALFIYEFEYTGRDFQICISVPLTVDDFN